MAVSSVLGNSGFLGSNLSKRLLEKGHFVILVNNFSTGNVRNRENVSTSYEFMMLNKSVTDSELINLVKEVDSMFYFASTAASPKYQALGLETLSAKPFGTENLIKLTLKIGLQLILHPQVKIMAIQKFHHSQNLIRGYVNPRGPKRIYDKSKRFDETLVHHYESSDR